MTDNIRIGYEVDTAGLKSAESAVDSLANKTEHLAGSTKKIEGASIGARSATQSWSAAAQQAGVRVEGAGKSATATGQMINYMNTAFEKQAGVVGKVGAATNAYNVSMVRAGASLDKTSVGLNNLAGSATKAGAATATFAGEYGNWVAQARAGERFNLPDNFNKAGKAAADASKGIGLARHELVNFSRQVQDVVVSLGSGQGLGTVIMQQGMQMGDILANTSGTMRGFGEQAKTAFGIAATWAGRAITSVAGVATGVASLAAGALFLADSWQDGQKAIDRSLSGIGRASGVTRAEINAIGRESASAFGLSTAEATRAASAFAATGKISSTVYGDLIRSAKDYAALIGTDVDTAIQKLAKSFSSGIEGAKALNNELGQLGAGEMRSIERKFDVGDSAAAQKQMVEALAAATKGQAAAATGALEQLWTGFSNLLSNGAELIGRAADAAMQKITGLQTNAQDRFNKALADAERAKAAIDKLQAGGRPRDAIGGQNFDTHLSALKAGLDAANASTKAAAIEMMNLDTQIESVKEKAASIKVNVDIQNYAPAIANLETLFDKAQRIRDALNKKPGSGGSELNAAQIKAGEQAEEAIEAQAIALKGLEASYPGLTQQSALFVEQKRMEVEALQAVTAEQRRAIELNNNERRGVLGAKGNAGAVAEAQAIDTTAFAQAEKLTRDTLTNLRGQTEIASAITVEAQMRAQHDATVAQLSGTVLGTTQAILVADQQRAAAQAAIDSGAERQLIALERQLSVAEAVGGAEKMRAQEIARTAQLIDQNVGPEKASAIAAKERAVAEASVNAAAQQTLASLQAQAGVAAAVTGDEKIRAQAAATYTQLLDQGVSSSVAMAVAAQQEANARAQASAAVERQTMSLNQQTALIYARMNGNEAEVRAAQAYQNAIAAGASEAAALGAKMAVVANETAKAAAEAQRLANEFNKATDEARRLADNVPKGGRWLDGKSPAIGSWTPDENTRMATGGMRTGAGGFNRAVRKALDEQYTIRNQQEVRSRSPSDAATQQVDAVLKAGGSFADAIAKLTESLGSEGEWGEARGAAIMDLIDRIARDDPAKATALLQQQIAEIQKLPRTLARDDMLETMKDQLEELKKIATKDFEKIAEEEYARTGGPQGAIEKILGGGAADLISGSGEAQSQLEALYELLDAQTGDTSMHEAYLKREIALLQGLPISLKRDQMIKTLNDSLNELQEIADKDPCDPFSELYNASAGDERLKGKGFYGGAANDNEDYSRFLPRATDQLDIGSDVIVKKPKPGPDGGPPVGGRDPFGVPLPQTGGVTGAGGTAQTGATIINFDGPAIVIKSDTPETFYKSESQLQGQFERVVTLAKKKA